MAARAMWKGVIRFPGVRVPVKLYAAVQDRSVHFRLLHRKDHAPVRQAMINPETEAVVAYRDIRRAYVTDKGNMVILDDEELAALEPEESRDIEVVQFLPPAAIDHRWYQRPYYLGPDAGAEQAYADLTAALEKSGREGLAHWVMRGKACVGALRVEAGYPMLVSLRHAEEVVSARELGAPQGPAPAKREIEMARQLVDMLADEFEADRYQDSYRARVQDLIETKARGDKVHRKRAPKRRAPRDLAGALEASIEQERKRA